MGDPDYIICMECESPVYTFEWRDGRITDPLCTLCGNDDPVLFATEEQLEEFAGIPEED